MIDLRVMAYVDDELDPAARAAFEAEMAADPALGAAVQRERSLRAALAAAYDPVLDEPLPAALRAAVRAPAGVVDLGAAREARARAAPGRWRAPEWGAMAACLVLGIALGLGAGPFTPTASQGDAFVVRGADGTLLARGALDRQLSGALAADPAGPGGIAVGLSFKARDGRYCRSFALDAEVTTGGLACRADGVWRVQALLPADGSGVAPGSYRQAATALPPALLQQVERLREGEVLDAAGERAARERGWR